MTSLFTLCLTHIGHFFSSLKLVAWSFFGVRKKRDLERDFKLHPIHILTAAIFAGILFVLALGFAVRLALRTLS